MAPARHRPRTACENERFPTEWALYDDGVQDLSEDAGSGGWAPVSPAEETIGRPPRGPAQPPISSSQVAWRRNP